MAVKVADLLGSELGALRYQPTPKRIRVCLGGEPVADTVEAVLIWEPRRVVPTYAVPRSALAAQLVPAGGDVGDDEIPGFLDPSVPFTAHTCPGTAFDVIAGEETGAAAAFQPDDPELTAYVILDFATFEWREEDEPIVAHPHDPFHRIDVRRSRRRIRIELDGKVLAESCSPMLLFETGLPTRHYLPREDVTADLDVSDTVTYCAYKGRAAYYSLPGGPADVAWAYHEPLIEAVPVRDHICFFDERVDVFVDGERMDRPVTAWS
ncbi:DUF427 domain-containing protein [Mycolicibacterium peregrinum]|uniref:DUF427 domain-containing protein n=1 Tax=Mycolicibacterium peregrinum TaxID=43304 RepID=A0A4Z0HLD6_MYCPR|nr:DUF427 domain-containing protein [Mycolicibacterium peregrinum]TGB38766.1 DUF427 domain-containing protein [Mycolicibacterium peregrinum]TGB42129.1 DUF427 domain-containing protein [Mycolicibacterium peregrinum]